MSNPLVDRILNNPLTFVAAKAPEKEVQTIRSAGYIVLNSSHTPASSEPLMGPKKHPKREEKRPKSMAEAIAAYTGRKYLTKAEKKRKSRPQATASPDSESSGEEVYESASEFPSDSSFQEIQDTDSDRASGEDIGENMGENMGESDESTGEEVGESVGGGRDTTNFKVAKQSNKKSRDLGAESDISASVSSGPNSSSSGSSSSNNSEEPETRTLRGVNSFSSDLADEKTTMEEESEEEDADFEGNESAGDSKSESNIDSHSESGSGSDSDSDHGSSGENDDNENGNEHEEGNNRTLQSEGSMHKCKDTSTGSAHKEEKDDYSEEGITPDNESDADAAHLLDQSRFDEDDDSISQQNEDRLQLKKDLLQDMEKPLSDENEAVLDDGNHASNGTSNGAKTAAGPSPKQAVVSSHYMLNEPEEHDESGRITRKWTSPYKSTKPVGLLNFGVTCYMNSALQILVHIPAVQHYLVEVLQGKHKAIKPRSVTHTFAELALRMWGIGSKKTGPRKHVNPKKMVQRLDDINCMMSEWQQEDSHEYFMSLMSRLQEDSTPKGQKLNQSVLYDIFGGLLDQEVICQECKTSSVTKQEFYDLSLGLNKKRSRSNDGIDTPADDDKLSSHKYTIEKSICDFFSMETIRVDKNDASSGYTCEKCHKRTVATKKSAIETSPHALMVHLKRFKFNGNSSSKVKQPIHYSKFLDLSAYTTTGASIKYQLMGVIVHEGRSISSGHYVAHCYQPDGTWSTYDDEYINKIDETTALSDPSAYCLVYMKMEEKTKSEEKTKKRAKNKTGPHKKARTA